MFTLFKLTQFCVLLSTMLVVFFFASLIGFVVLGYNYLRAAGGQKMELGLKRD